MKVEKITELRDGGADIELELTDQEIQFFVGHAVNSILKEYIEKEKEKVPKKRDKFDKESLKE